MTNPREFIQNNIGVKVYVNDDGDLSILSELKNIIYNKTELTIVELTKGGMAKLVDANNVEYKVPPKNVSKI